jgi:predicted chitinase
LADAQEHGIITKRINGGTLGLDDRILKTTKALSVLG